MSGMEFVKGHGTGNDFVVLPDVDAELELSDAAVAAICDRHFGIGADGILRVVPSAAMPGVADPAARWFMDYRNADGSAVEMCGNGIRVFARYLHAAGLETAEEFPISTRDGIKVVTRKAVDTYAVDMGRPVIGRPATLELDRTSYDAMQVSMGNPHAVIFVDDVGAAMVTTHGPRIEMMPIFPQGTNVEFVRVDDKETLTLRVWERGVGETLSCGTGACAAAVASAYDGQTGRRVDVDVRGGRLHVEWTEDDRVIMTGPAVFVASGEIDGEWLAALP
jgi:diaminopimelate epimerase